MTAQSTKLIYFGNEQLAQGIKASTPIFDALANAGYQICALILPTAHTRKPFPIDLRAKALNIPVFYTKDAEEILKIIADFQPEVGILAAYSKFIPDRIINAFPTGIVNIHPSLLPKYRGTTPIESALLNNDTETGISIMQLAHQMDGGNVYRQIKIALAPEITKQALYEQLAKLGAQALIDTLPSILDHTNSGATQDDQAATYSQPLSKELSLLDFANKSADTLVREVIAYAGFPKSKCTLYQKNCTITQAHVATAPTTKLDQLCADGNYFCINRLIAENSKEMDAKSFLNGLQNQH